MILTSILSPIAHNKSMLSPGLLGMELFWHLASLLRLPGLHGRSYRLLIRYYRRFMFLYFNFLLASNVFVINLKDANVMTYSLKVHHALTV